MRTIISQRNPFGADRYGFLWEKLSEHNSPGKHLDYGAYDGMVLKQLFESNVIREGIGLDLNKKIIDESKTSMPDGVSLMAIEKKAKLPFKDEEFDTISMLDVIEHVHDQKSLLIELHRILKRGGKIILTVPKKHLFSCLDFGNLKFLFPVLHKWYCQLRYSKEKYEQRYCKCENGLFGDIEVEKMWHQHFSENELKALLNECGFTDVKFDGSGLFTRPLLSLSFLLPFMKAVVKKLASLDARCFESMNCFVIAAKDKKRADRLLTTQIKTTCGQCSRFGTAQAAESLLGNNNMYVFYKEADL